MNTRPFTSTRCSIQLRKTTLIAMLGVVLFSGLASSLQAQTDWQSAVRRSDRDRLIAKRNLWTIFKTGVSYYFGNWF